MRRLVYRPAAQADLRRIGFHSLEQFGLRQTQTYLGRIEIVIFDLAMGRRFGRGFHPLKPELLRHRIAAHVVFYRVTDDVLTVIRVLHGRMNVEDHL